MIVSANNIQSLYQTSLYPSLATRSLKYIHETADIVKLVVAGGMLKDVDDVDGVIPVLHPDVPAYVGLDLAQVVAVGALESGLLAALVTQMAGQVPLPREDAPAVRIRTRKLTGVLA